MTGGGPYRLQALLEVRQREEDDKKIELSDATRATQLARERESQARKACEDARLRRADAQAKRKAKLDTGQVSVTEMTTAQRFDRRLLQTIDESTAKMAAAAQLVRDAQLIEDAARAALAEAAKARKAIEKHKEKWNAEKKREREQRAESEADDLANRRS